MPHFGVCTWKSIRWHTAYKPFDSRRRSQCCKILWERLLHGTRLSALILIKGQMEMEIINVNWIILLVKDTRRIWGRTKIFFIIQLRYVLTANLSIKKRKKKHQINHSNLFEFLIKKGGAKRRNCYLYWLCLNLKRDTMLKIQIGGIRLKHLWA